MNALLAKLSEQPFQLGAVEDAAGVQGLHAAKPDSEETSSSSVPRTPATEAFSTTPPTEATEEAKCSNEETSEMERLKIELDVAKSKIARQEQELSQTRFVRQVLDESKSNAQVAGDTTKHDMMDRTIVNLQDAFNASRPTGSYGNQDDARSDISDTLSASAFTNRAPGTWAPTHGFQGGMQGAGNIWNPGAGRPWINRPMAPPLQPIMLPPQQQLRSYSGASSPVSNGTGKMTDFTQYPGNNGDRRHNLVSFRSSSVLGQPRASGWDSYGGNADMPPFVGMNQPGPQPMGMFQAPIGYQPRPIGTPLSPTAAEFTSTGAITPWNSTVGYFPVVERSKLT